MLTKIITLQLLFIIYPCIAITFQCRDQNNQNVDWFIFYKIARMHKSSIELARNGSAFLYMDAKDRKWLLSEVSIENAKQSIGFTLQQYYDAINNLEIFSVMYNDEFPYPENETVSATAGHAKGVVVFSKMNGFWLIHSVPKFPRNRTYEYPKSGLLYGQMGLCVSMNYSQLHKIALHLYYSHIFIYSYKLPSHIAADIPLLQKVVSKEHQHGSPFYRQDLIYSTDGQEFMHFAKIAAFKKDLYFDLLAPAIKASLAVGTWQHETSINHNLHSWCTDQSPYKVLDVKNITLPFNITFSNLLDHSKFAVSIIDYHKIPVPWVCIGDINRQQHQLVRAGGTMCFVDFEVHAAYTSMITECWPCTSVV
ncbi:unnamed protein product [Thelazia callipaeda]|uniref:Deoxyribonuclease II n=1 Tax=Thelazia callipaeda TaxID=103827 RepID=A0A0N5CU24_THECL|nr:unnamed protein product [Thelazia callipaeda]